MKAFAIAASVLFTAAVFLTSSSCAPECVDIADCVKFKPDGGRAKEEYTCDKGVCKLGSPFLPYDAGQ